VDNGDGGVLASYVVAGGDSMLLVHERSWWTMVEMVVCGSI